MRPKKIRTVLKWSLRLAALTAVVMLLGLLFWLRTALSHHFIAFPRQTTALAALRAEHRQVTETSGWKEYRGVLHTHSKLSHDCQVPFEEILRVLQATDRDFICLSDHCVEGRADFNAQWRGLHEGKLFIPGFEMRDGVMPFGVRPDVVLSNSTPVAVLARQVIDGGGVLFYAHPEEPRDWGRPELTGMEIYNVHANFKAKGGLLRLLPDLLVNQRPYPEQVLHMVFDRPTANLDRWDYYNANRHLTGIAGNDCHQNTGLRLVYTASDQLRLEDTSPKTITERKLNAATRWLARLCFGPLIPGRELLHVQLDPYERMVRFVNTHILARELSEGQILESLKAGRVFVAFDMLADSRGFLWLAKKQSEQATMGESLTWSAGTQLRACAPQNCRFSIIKDGHRVWQAEGRNLDWTPPGPGVYRVEAELRLVDEWVPWIYANPIWLR